MEKSMKDLGLSWEGIPKKWKWMTVDDDGGVWVYTDKPFQKTLYNMWVNNNNVNLISNIEMTSGIDWKTLIWERKNNE